MHLKRVKFITIPLIVYLVTTLLSCGSSTSTTGSFNYWEITKQIILDIGGETATVDSNGKITLSSSYMISPPTPTTEEWESVISDQEIANIKSLYEEADVFNQDDITSIVEGCEDGGSTTFTITTDSEMENSFIVGICGGSMPEELSNLFTAINELVDKYRP